MTQEKIFTSQIDPKYSIKCWKGDSIAYAFRVRQTNVDLMAEPDQEAVPPMDVPDNIVAELRPLAIEFLGRHP